MKKAFMMVSTLAAALVVTACTKLIPTDTNMGHIQGNVTYRERIALPDDAKVTVTLEDVSLADAPAEVLSRQTFLTDGKQPPFAYQLSYQSDQIEPNHRYIVSARIEGQNGKLLFVSDTAYPVLTNAAKTETQDILVINAQ